ncbi:MAG TPA: chromosome partitioning protein ParB [Candidatus Woesebacteria bacterium]|nr:chromosome partitioning protein ParB [Candidatus Woesebacteria bacterium]
MEQIKKYTMTINHNEEIQRDNGSFYKIVDLFGNEQKVMIQKDNKKPNLFSDYEGFLEKFEVKKTTDDCYTPPEVMDIILEYVNEKYPLEGKKIVRPFYPGGDYEAVEYTDDMVVIDNPPFSIITKICRFYIENNVKFFLFAPHLTLFTADIDCTHIVASADIIYENNANVKTSFLSNLFGDVKIIGAADLNRRFKKLNDKNKVNLPKYVYPDNIITVSKIAYCVEKGISITIDKKDVMHYKGMDAQKVHKKSIFGAGFICSDKAAAATAAAKDKENVIEWELSAKDKENVIEWELSAKEKEIIRLLGD